VRETRGERREERGGRARALDDPDPSSLSSHFLHRYPNIILTNRLQPSAIVTDEDCAACDFNRPGKTCLRSMEWVWRGEAYAATSAELRAIKAQLESEPFPPAEPGGAPRLFYSLPPDDRAKLVKDRLKAYCQKVYKRVLDKPATEVGRGEERWERRGGGVGRARGPDAALLSPL
jgi:hypothetical protein